MTVVVPAGLPLVEAAAWVGASCWLELRAHARLTALLAAPDLHDELRVELWRVRAHRAETAEQWHRRLPELREMPRPDLLRPPAGAGAAADDDAPPSVDEVVALLEQLDDRYAAHEEVAVGPADGPVRATLSSARVLLAWDRSTLTR